MSVKPISPQEAKDNFITTIPDIVIECINIMLSEKGTKHEIVLNQDDIVKRVMATGKIANFKTEWLDFEDVYRKVGWSVESDPSKYTFKAKRTSNNDVTIY
jgi:hypothetical protein